MIDIVEAVTRIFGAPTIERLAAALGVTPAVADRLVTGSVPSLLASILGKTREPGGARLLASVLERQPANLTDIVVEAIGTPRQQGVIDDGISGIGTLLGSSSVGQIAGVLSKFGATGIGNARNALGLVMPAILGVLGREQTARKLDASGLANLLGGQHQAISAAIPPSLRPLLDDTGLLDEFDAAASASASAARADAGHAARVRDASDYIIRPSPGSEFSWPSWIAAIAAASVMWWSVFGDRVMAFVTGVPPPSVSRLVGAPERLMIGTTDLGAETTGTLAMLDGVLTGIRGDVTARLSLPKLNELVASLERLRNLSGQLTPDRRRQFSALVASRTGELTAAISAAEAAPGAAPIVRPAVDQLRARLAALAK